MRSAPERSRALDCDATQLAGQLPGWTVCGLAGSGSAHCHLGATARRFLNSHEFSSSWHMACDTRSVFHHLRLTQSEISSRGFASRAPRPCRRASARPLWSEGTGTARVHPFFASRRPNRPAGLRFDSFLLPNSVDAARLCQHRARGWRALRCPEHQVSSAASKGSATAIHIMRRYASPSLASFSYLHRFHLPTYNCTVRN